MIMVVYKNMFTNCMQDSIELIIERFRANNSQCKISIIPQRDLRWFLRRPLIYILTVTLIINYIFLNYFTSQHRLTSSLIIIISCIVIFYLFSPITKESIILFDNFQGIEYEKHYLFLEPSSTFINTNQIVINEAVTMQRVIFLLVAIPHELHKSILDVDPSNTSESTSPSLFDQEKTKLVPLFIRTLPRLNCLKIIYSHVLQFRKEQNKSLELI